MCKAKKVFLLIIYSVALVAIGVIAGIIGYRTSTKSNPDGIDDSINGIKDGVGLVDIGTATVESGSAEIADGADDIESGLGDIESGTGHIAQGVTGLDRASKLLAKLIDDLEDSNGDDSGT